MRINPTRRLLLQALGLAGGSQLLPSLGGRKAEAAPIPTRFVVFHSGYGINRSLWAPTGTETSFQLNEVHAPLASYKDQLLILDGIDMLSTLYDPNSASSAHIAGETHALSANRRRRASNGQYDWSSITIDQFIAKEINKPTPVTRFPSLELAVSFDGDQLNTSSDGTGAYLPGEPDPERAFKRLFPTPVSGPSTPAPAGDPAADQRRSVLEFVANRFKTLQPRLSKLDQTRFDAHASAIRDLEKRFDITTPPAAVSCSSDDSALAAVRSARMQAGYLSSQRWYESTLDAHLRNAQLALACDLTRVVSIGFSDPEKSIDYTSGMLGTTDYHDLVHKTDNGITGARTFPLSGNADALAVRKRHALFQATQFAKFLGYLRAVPTGDGQTLLDHTVVLWSGHIGWGGHQLSNLPWMLAGSGGGYFKTGRYLQLPRAPHPLLQGEYSDGLGLVPDAKVGPSTNDLFVSIANAMGVNISTFGEPGACKGPIAKLRG
jgi:hypothetical protein